MLIRPHDDGSADEAGWRAFVVAQGLGHFVAAGRGRDVPVVVPTQFLLDGDRVLFHLARPNPVFACLEENPHALMSVAGDWAYIPSAWKAIGDEDPARGIPTTYYQAVQLIGTVEIRDDPAEVAGILRRQLDHLQPAGGHIDPAEHDRLLGAIRGIELTVTSVRVKAKYGGNVDVAHRQHVAEQLRQRGGPGDRAAASRIPLATPPADEE